MSNEPGNTDQELEDYLGGKSDISAIYAETKTVTAPDRLCADIKALAKAELAKKKSNRSWFVPLSLVATIVVSVTVYFFAIRQPDITDMPRMANETTENNPPASKQDTASAEIKQQQTTTTAANKTPEIPAHIKDLLQDTSSRTQIENGDYPTAKELKSWAVERWLKKIKQLQADGKQQQADRYIRDFTKYHPGLDIKRLLAEQ